MNWDRRDRIFRLAAPLAVVPAVAFLPSFVLVFLRSVFALPPLPAARIAGLAAIFPLMIFVQLLGTILLGFAGFRAGIGYLTVLAVATSVFLAVVAAYTGLFFGIFVGPGA
jgi:hypothetical protein